MRIKVEQNKKRETVITLPVKFDEAALDEAFRYMRYLYLTRGYKKVTQADADKLADEITAAAARKRRKKLAS
jgi:hypothetical protein